MAVEVEGDGAADRDGLRDCHIVVQMIFAAGERLPAMRGF